MRTPATTAAESASDGRCTWDKSRDNLGQLYNRPARVDLQAEHFAHHSDSDLKPHSGEKTHQHCSREEVGNKTELEQSRHQQEPRREQRHHSRQCHIFRAGRRRHAGDSPGEDGGGGGVGGHYQEPRRTERRESQKRQQERVESGDRGHAGDGRVAQSLRDVHRRQFHSGHGIAADGRAVEWPHASK